MNDKQQELLQYCYVQTTVTNELFDLRRQILFLVIDKLT